MMKKKIHLVFLAILFSGLTYSQTTNSVKKDSIRSDADLRSGNFRDVLTNFFQLAINDLTGDDKRLRFSSSLFALRLKTNPNLNIDKYYKDQTFYRNSNIDFDLKLDSNYNYNGASFGYKYALVNKRDYTIAKNFPFLLETALQDHTDIFNKISEEINSTYSNDAPGLARVTADIDRFIANGSSVKFNELNTESQNVIKRALAGSNSIDPNWKFGETAKELYEKVVSTYKDKLLWTLAAKASTYSDGLLVSNLDFITQATAGMLSISRRSNIEFDIKGEYKFLDNNIITKKDLNRQNLSFEGGLNFVVRDGANNKPVFELKAAGEYSLITKGLYVNETKENFTLNGTIRFRFTNNLWIPLEFKYDPDQCNVLGLLSVKLNFD